MTPRYTPRRGAVPIAAGIIAGFALEAPILVGAGFLAALAWRFGAE